MKFPHSLALPLALFATAAAWLRPAPQSSSWDNQELRELLHVVSFEDTPIDEYGHTARTLVISGVSVQIVNGTGSLNSTNGAGNLIVGYPGEGGASGLRRTGSHNLVGGESNDWTSWGGIVFGDENEITAPMSVILSGNENDAIGGQSVIVGGWGNLAAGIQSVIVGGSQNYVASDTWDSVVLGGAYNGVTGWEAVVGGGESRTAPGPHDFVAGSLWEDN